MKAKDLMVGDYVLYDGLILKVGALTDYDIKIDLLKGDELYAQFWDEDMDNIQGIPLTPEILEKNFKEFIPGLNLMYGLGGPYVASDEEGQWVFGLVRKEPSARYPLVKITYVHELQHALRLCGIDKEIVV